MAQSVPFRIVGASLPPATPSLSFAARNRGRSLIPRYYSYGRNPPLREVAAREATKETFQVRGTYERIAERLIDVMNQVGGDAEFVDNVVPILQREAI